MEFQELEFRHYFADDALRHESQVLRLDRLASRISDNLERKLCLTDQLGGWLRDGKFVDVQEHIVQVPLGIWPKNKRQVRHSATILSSRS